jgi:GH15 family glucan-1,4-alpha-glucosidase
LIRLPGHSSTEDNYYGYGFYNGGESKTVHYWMVGATSIPEALTLNAEVMKKTPEHILESTTDFWHAWVNKYNFSFYSLTPDIVKLFKRSLMIVRAHTDDGGAIIASGDSDMLHQGKDTYAYMWPRDGAFSAVALDRAGDSHVARRFFEFCKGVISTEGYFMHKYLPDQSLGSSWHPYIRDGQFQLPIQEDETALVIWALYEHYKRTRDVEFIESMYNEVIEKAADFMLSYRDTKTNLPKSSYDLWEEKYGVSTFTACAVYGALIAAAEFSKLLGKENNEAKYRKGAEEVKVAVLKHLYDEKLQYFIKQISFKGKEIVRDTTLDTSSMFGVFLFKLLPVNDPRLVKVVALTEEGLSKNITVKGLARYEGDNYYRVSANTPGNPWIITTLWLAQYYISQAQTEKEFSKVRTILTWVAKYAQPSGVLSEQLHPENGEQIGATPLTWSHSEYINTVICYLNRLEELGYCKACNPAS